MAYDDLVCAPSVPLAIIPARCSAIYSLHAHERTLASLNNGRPPYAVRWKGCVHLKKGMQVDVVGSDAEGTEIVYQRKHLFADDPLF